MPANDCIMAIDKERGKIQILIGCEAQRGVRGELMGQDCHSQVTSGGWGGQGSQSIMTLFEVPRPLQHTSFAEGLLLSNWQQMASAAENLLHRTCLTGRSNSKNLIQLALPSEITKIIL